jgi:hypothetical protein
MESVHDGNGGGSGTDVFRSFTRVYVVFRIQNKPNNQSSYLQVFSKKYFLKDLHSLIAGRSLQYICLIVNNECSHTGKTSQQKL